MRKRTPWGNKPKRYHLKLLRCMKPKERYIYAHLVRIHWPLDRSFATSRAWLSKRFRLSPRALQECVRGLKEAGLVRSRMKVKA